MIVYFDASALVKRFVREVGTDLVQGAFRQALVRATAASSGSEVPAAFSAAVRAGRLTPQEAHSILAGFWQQWPSLAKVPLTESLARQAGDLAWWLGLRGTTASHLASALATAALAGEPVTLATFDRQLWQAARNQGLAVIPEEIELYLR